ncbi:hypothetical protein [Penaeicola halotolerans]|uniref:hypothetical protein n=1 Tax=Penaeicola halotolerans TaxID=2793196 RepID=UPI001CF8A02C|nr:hypothetical protein [Penaeicola halotolerans]
MLFAIDRETQEVIVSESPKGSKKVNFVERIALQDNKPLYEAVALLTMLTSPEHFDTSTFKAMDKVCQLLYNKHKGI